MKKAFLTYLLPILGLLTLPFVYNSCGKFISRNNSSSSTKYCKAVMENGQKVSRLMDPAKANSPFKNGKVRLRKNKTTDSVMATASTDTAAEPVTVKTGTRLAVLLYNSCLLENHDSHDKTVITREATATSDMIPQLDVQAYSWFPKRDYTDSEIQALADQEQCIRGLSWSHNYRLSTSFPAPTDPGIPNQKHLAAIKWPEAFGRFFNDGGGMSLTGNNVTVAVIDSGVDWRHPDLQSAMWRPYIGDDDQGNKLYGWGIDIPTLVRHQHHPTYPINFNPMDISPIGHGTHVAGIIGAIGGNSVGIAGIMPHRLNIMGVKIFKMQIDGGGHEEMITNSEFFINGVRFAFLNHADVINLSVQQTTDSVSGVTDDEGISDALESAVAAGTTVITVMGNASSGNGREVNRTNFWSIPAQYSGLAGVIGVGSYEIATGNKSFFSHYSTTYGEIAAPGAQQGTQGIYSTISRSVASPPNDASKAYGPLAGTSQAGPMVSAAAALAIGIIREATGAPPTPAEVERLITTSANKSTALQSYFKDGNSLDLQSLASLIATEYPETATGSDEDEFTPTCP